MFILRKLFIRFLLLYGLLLILAYLFVRIQLVNFSPALVIFSLLLFLAELHTIFHFFGMVYSLWPRKYKTYSDINYNKNLELNLLICVCGEPVELVRETILAAKETVKQYIAVVHPDKEPRIVVLNDGYAAKKDNWNEIIQLCVDLNVYYSTRNSSDGFKAGNINNGISQLITYDPHNTIDIVFDADFSAKPELLTEITKPFVDDSVDFVQTPQRYKNEMTWVAKAAAAHQIYFFDYICNAKAHDNALFLCGTNFAIRREALNSVDGMDTRFITEDYSTSLNLHLSGKKGVFIAKVLALGVAPSTLKAYFNQQRRWAKGTFDASFTYLGKLLFGPLTYKQKFHYLLSATYYLIGVRDFILMLAPIPFLFFGVSLIRANTLGFLTFIYAPLFMFNFILYLLLFKEPLKSLVLDLISFPIFVSAFLSSILKKNLAFIVTIKKYEKENIFQVYKLQFVVMATLLAGLIYSITKASSGNPLATYINYLWASFDVSFLFLGFFLILRDNYGKKLDERLYVTAHLGNFNFPIKRVLIPAMIIVFGIIISRTPSFRSVVTMDNMYLLVNAAQGKVIAQELMVPSTGAYYGYYQPQLNQHPDNPKLSIIPGEKPSLAMYYEDWGNQAGFDKPFVDQIAEQNVIPVITWEPWDAKKAAQGIINQEEFYPKVITSGKYDDFIRSWAREAAAYKKPFFLRFAQEMNGDWYPWGNAFGNTPEDYKQMWIHVYNIFAQEHADNVIWVWSPNNTDAYGSSDSMLSYYPGDKYVDWIGYSGFNWGESGFLTKWTIFKDLSQAAYQELIKINKPIMVTETSSTSIGGDKGQWFADTLKKDIPSMPRIKAVIFFHDDFRNVDFSLLKGMPTYKVIKENIVDNNYYVVDPIIVHTVKEQ